MKHLLLLSLLNTLLIISGCAQNKPAEPLEGLPPLITDKRQYNELEEFEAYVILKKGTERAFTGAFHDLKDEGLYICKQCNNPLFSSSDKFNSGTGWPSFDDAIPGAVREIRDADGYRMEIVCANCGGHLGHAFRGEGFTEKDLRHCVNSVSLNFVPASLQQSSTPEGVVPIETYIKGKGYENLGSAIFAGGCFWCTEASFDQLEGVVEVISGYSGGEEPYPTYEAVSSGQSRHAEAVMVFYDPAIVSYETLLDVFFVAHDPTTLNRQGPDVGPQYRSAIFFRDETQKTEAETFIRKLESLGVFNSPIVTELAPYTEFWVAEAYHQNYYDLHPESTYIQRISKPKVEKVQQKFKDRLKD